MLSRRAQPSIEKKKQPSKHIEFLGLDSTTSTQLGKMLVCFLVLLRYESVKMEKKIAFQHSRKFHQRSS